MIELVELAAMLVALVLVWAMTIPPPPPGVSG